MECPEGRSAAVLSERRVAAEKLLCQLPVLPVSHPTDTPVLWGLLLSRCTCKRMGTGRRHKSSCSDTSWPAGISSCFFVQTLDKKGRNCRTRVGWARTVAAHSFPQRTKPLVVPLKHSAFIQYTQMQVMNSCDKGVCGHLGWKSECSKYFWKMSRGDEAWLVWALRRENMHSELSFFNFKMEDSHINACRLEQCLIHLLYLLWVLVQCQSNNRFPNIC